MEIGDYSYHRPQTLAAACDLGRTFGDEGRFLAGGTELLVDLKNKRDQADHVISLRDIAELRRIALEAGILKIGALATLTEIATSPLVNDFLPALPEAILNMGGQQIRNQGTIGGNFCRAVPCADTPPICIAAAAQLHIVGVESERTVAAEEFFRGPRQTIARRDEILTEIRIPPLPARFGARYERFSLRRGSALAVASVAASVVLTQNKIRTARVVLGAVAPVPLVVSECSRLLAEAVPGPDLYRQAGKLAARAAQPITDLRGTEAYRRELTAVLTARALAAATSRARGESG
jgi:carbon-monoxide dehydrogenase medium subunit